MCECERRHVGHVVLYLLTLVFIPIPYVVLSPETEWSNHYSLYYSSSSTIQTHYTFQITIIKRQLNTHEGGGEEMRKIREKMHQSGKNIAPMNNSNLMRYHYYSSSLPSHKFCISHLQLQYCSVCTQHLFRRHFKQSSTEIKSTWDRG